MQKTETITNTQVKLLQSSIFKEEKSDVHIDNKGNIIRTGKALERHNQQLAASAPEPNPADGGGKTLMEDDSSDDRKHSKGCCVLS